MDNLTHSLTGVLLSRAGLNRLHKQSVWILLLSANIPDVDVVSALGGTANYFHNHRWITHAIVMAPVNVLLFVAIPKVPRKIRPLQSSSSPIFSSG